MRLYHGTTRDGANEIMECGYLRGPVYFSPEREVAADYALNNDLEGAVVICMEIDDLSILNIDNESYDGDDLETALDEGVSVYTSGDMNIIDADFDKIGYDYEN